VGDGAVKGHRRLAIVDVCSRTNHVASADGDIIVFNGEIYSFRELRRDLRLPALRCTAWTPKCSWRCSPRRERMLPKAARHLPCIWDTPRLFPRASGSIKPSPRADQPRPDLRLQIERCSRRDWFLGSREPAGWQAFSLGQRAEPDSFSAACSRYPPNIDCAKFRRCGADAGTTSTRCKAARSRQTIEEQVRQAERFCAATCGGCAGERFLSGGIDSGAIAGLVSELGARIEGITVGFEEFAGLHDDETTVARAVAKHYGLPHHVRMVSRAEFEQDIPHILDAMDQPSIDGVNTWFAG
jgi:asparagine synthase (glutamine-hydrolysing)